ncbi:MAG: hypothetical protein PHF31_01870 [Methylobacter sp.]|nr:hypothetical protein [Methylobacter sp.]
MTATCGNKPAFTLCACWPSDSICCASGLADTNTLMIYLSKAHYASLRESVTATNYQAQQLLEGLKDKMSSDVAADPHFAALKQIPPVNPA